MNVASTASSRQARALGHQWLRRQPTATSSAPAGATRSAAIHSGSSPGREAVMIEYVLPQAIGAATVPATDQDLPYVFMISILMLRC